MKTGRTLLRICLSVQLLNSARWSFGPLSGQRPFCRTFFWFGAESPWLPAAVSARSLRCCAIRSPGTATDWPRDGRGLLVFVFLFNDLDFIRVKTIPTGQNADFGGFVRSKANHRTFFWFGAESSWLPAAFSARSLRCCAIRSPGTVIDRPRDGRGPVNFVFSSAIWISSWLKRFLPDKMLI